MSSVYFARIGDDGPIKIGTTTDDPAARVASLQCGCPWRIRLVGAVAGCRAHEIFLHDRLDSHRMLGEWFQPHTAVIETMASVLAGRFAWPITWPEQTAVANLIEAFGGATAFGRVIGKGQSTASEMKRTGAIGARYWTAIVSEARRRGLELDWITPEALMLMHAPQAEAAK